MVMNLMWYQLVKKSPIGYFLEVDLEYPDKLQDLHNDDLLAPEKHAVSSNMLSKYCKKYADKYEIKVGDVKKLIPNLANKTNYVVTEIFSCICL